MQSDDRISTELRRRWLRIFLAGLLMIGAGLFVLGNAVLFTWAIVMVFAAAMAVTGAAAIGVAFTLANFWLAIALGLIGLVYLAAGAVAFSAPASASMFFTMSLVILLIASGLFRTAIGLRYRALPASRWIVLSGLATLAAGTWLLVKWPMASMQILGGLFGADLIIAGAGLVILSLEARKKP